MLAQGAGWAATAAIAPIMHLPTLAKVAGMGFLSDDIHQQLSTKLFRHAPSLGLVDPYQMGTEGRVA